MKARLRWRRGGKRSRFWFWECPCGATGFWPVIEDSYTEAAIHVALKHRRLW